MSARAQLVWQVGHFAGKTGCKDCKVAAADQMVLNGGLMVHLIIQYCIGSTHCMQKENGTEFSKPAATRAAGAAGPPCRGCCIEPCCLWCATPTGGRPTARRAPSACAGGTRTSAPANHERLASKILNVSTNSSSHCRKYLGLIPASVTAHFSHRSLAIAHRLHAKLPVLGREVDALAGAPGHVPRRLADQGHAARARVLRDLVRLHLDHAAPCNLGARRRLDARLELLDLRLGDDSAGPNEQLHVGLHRGGRSRLAEGWRQRRARELDILARELEKGWGVCFL